MIATIGPAIKLVRSPDIFDIGIQRIGATESSPLSSMDGISLAIAGRFALSIAQAHYAVGAIFAGLQAVVSGPVDRECQVRCIHFVCVILVEAADAKVERARGELNLYGAVVKIQEGETGIFTEANHG